MSHVALRGTRVGVAESPMPKSMVICWRCGILFNHWLQSVAADAPCLDCRQILRDEGDKTVWRRKPKPKENT